MELQKKFKDLWNVLFETSNGSCGLDGYSYYAFISYTEKDENWAKWLQRKLEHYKIPTKVRNEHKELPKRVRPVFWYKNDLAGSHLNGAIKKELEQSKYLIVVCSRASAKKDWVNDEVRYFQDDLGRGERIIPFVVDGEIKSNDPERECLPIPIRDLPREEELRCIDVRLYGKNKALVNIVSTLFDVRFDVLWDRYKRERRRQFAIYGIVAILCSMVLFGCWDYYLHTKYEYFVNMDDCNGMPTGIIQIKNDEAKEHYRLYRFEYRRRMLQRVVYVDRDGNPQNHTNSELAQRPCIQELSYDDGELSVIKCQDADLKILYIMHYSKDKLAADLKDEDENQAANFIFSSTSADQGQSLFLQSSYLDRVLKTPSKIARYVYERDCDGYITKMMFARHNGDNDDIGMDANGISGFEYERDSLHQIVMIRFLDNQGEYKTNNMGVAGKKYQYDEYGNLIVAEYVDEKGKLKYNEDHWAKSVDQYDSKGFPIEERMFGPDGNPCISTHGYHLIRASYGDNNETTSLYDIHDNPAYALPRGGALPCGYSKVTQVRNEKGQVVEIRFMDSNGKLCFNQDHVAIQRFEHNDFGLVAGIRNYGIDGEPCSNLIGFAYECFSYNEQGCMTERCTYDVNGKPAQDREGIHRFTLKYDNTGRRMIEAHAYNYAGFPVYCSVFNGAAWVQLGYVGSSRWVSEVLFYSAENKPFETNSGSKMCCERDPYGQIVRCKYYTNNDDDYELISNDNQCAIMEIAYNDLGMEIDRRFYDENKAPMLLSGIFRISKSYTNTGRVEKTCLYDTLQHLCVGAEGWAIQEFEYNNGAISAVAVYKEDKEPVEIKGVHKFVYEVDDCGHIRSLSSFNKDMQPTVNSEANAFKVVYVYDDNLRNIGADYYNTEDQKPFVCIRQKLNQKGLMIEQVSYDAENELIESAYNFGVATIQSTYDSQDRVTYSCAKGKNGEKMNSSNGFAEAYYIYENNMQEYVFLDSKMNLVNNVGLKTPIAYFLLYLTDATMPLYEKTIRLSDDDDIETERVAYCYDSLGQNVQKAIRCDDEQIQVYDVLTRQMNTYYSFEDEYDEYVHIIDSIRGEVELKYGQPKLSDYIVNP